MLHFLCQIVLNLLFLTVCWVRLLTIYRYRRNGLLQMLKRNSSVKLAPQRWQENASDGSFDVILTFEEKVFDMVVEGWHVWQLMLAYSLSILWSMCCIYFVRRENICVYQPFCHGKSFRPLFMVGNISWLFILFFSATLVELMVRLKLAINNMLSSSVIWLEFILLVCRVYCLSVTQQKWLYWFQ